MYDCWVLGHLWCILRKPHALSSQLHMHNWVTVALWVHVPNIWVLRVIVVIVQVLGKYLIIRYFGPSGLDMIGTYDLCYSPV